MTDLDPRREQYAGAITDHLWGSPEDVDEATSGVMELADQEARELRRQVDIADSVTAETKRLLERRTKTLRERADRAEAVIEQVRAMHRPTEGVGYDCDEDNTPGSYGEIAQVCTTCGTPDEYGVRWPCATIRVLDRLSAQAATEATGQLREQRERPTHPDGTPYTYAEITAEGWGFCDGCRMWSTGTPERPHECAGTYNHVAPADQTTEA